MAPNASPACRPKYVPAAFFTALCTLPPLSAVLTNTLPMAALAAALAVIPAALVIDAPIACPIPGTAINAIDAADFMKSLNPAPRVSSSGSYLCDRIEPSGLNVATVPPGVVATLNCFSCSGSETPYWSSEDCIFCAANKRRR